MFVSVFVIGLVVIGAGFRCGPDPQLWAADSVNISGELKGMAAYVTK